MSCEWSLPLFSELVSVVIATQYFTVVLVNILILYVMSVYILGHIIKCADTDIIIVCVRYTTSNVVPRSETRSPEIYQCVPMAFYYNLN